MTANFTGEAFQGYRLAACVVFDKTGTLTEGRPALAEIEPLGASADEFLALAAAAESSSEHPLAEATVQAAFARGLTPPEVEDFEALPGRGVRAEAAPTRNAERWTDKLHGEPLSTTG